MDVRQFAYILLDLEAEKSGCFDGCKTGGMRRLSFGPGSKRIRAFRRIGTGWSRGKGRQAVWPGICGLFIEHVAQSKSMNAGKCRGIQTGRDISDPHFARRTFEPALQPSALQQGVWPITTNVPDFCTCCDPVQSLVRPGICYACWKAIREETSGAKTMEISVGVDRFDRDYLDEDDPVAVLRMQKSMT